MYQGFHWHKCPLLLRPTSCQELNSHQRSLKQNFHPRRKNNDSQEGSYFFFVFFLRDFRLIFLSFLFCIVWWIVLSPLVWDFCKSLSSFDFFLSSFFLSLSSLSCSSWRIWAITSCSVIAIFLKVIFFFCNFSALSLGLAAFNNIFLKELRSCWPLSEPMSMV